MGDQGVNLHLDRGPALPAQHQGQAKAGKAIQKNQAQSRDQPWHEHRPFDPPKHPPRRGPQGARHRHPLGTDLRQAVHACAHHQRQVEKQIAQQQQPGAAFERPTRLGQRRTQPATRTPQGQHPQRRHQGGHHKGQHQGALPQPPSCKVQTGQHPSHGQAQHQTSDTSGQRLQQRPAHAPLQVRVQPPGPGVLKRHARQGLTPQALPQQPCHWPSQQHQRKQRRASGKPQHRPALACPDGGQRLAPRLCDVAIYLSTTCVQRCCQRPACDFRSARASDSKLLGSWACCITGSRGVPGSAGYIQMLV